MKLFSRLEKMLILILPNLCLVNISENLRLIRAIFKIEDSFNYPVAMYYYIGFLFLPGL